MILLSGKFGVFTWFHLEINLMATVTPGVMTYVNWAMVDLGWR